MNTDIIHPEEAKNLEWYFSEGKSSFSRSLTGPMLSKAELYSAGTYPCYKCHDMPGINSENGDWCKHCDGTGFKSFTLGYNKEVTARPTAEVREAKGYEPNERTLIQYGVVSRRLDKLKVSFGTLGISVLEAYHGDEGARWGRERHGRMFALLPLTPSGIKLLKRIREEETDETNQIPMTPLEKLGVHAGLQLSQPKEWRRKLLEHSLSEAEQLYKRVASAYMLTSFHRNEKKKDRSAPTGDSSKKTRGSNKVPFRKNESWVAGTKPAKDTFKSKNDILKMFGKEN